MPRNPLERQDGHPRRRLAFLTGHSRREHSGHARGLPGEGLEPPNEVREASQAYRGRQDVLGLFLEEECKVIKDATVRCQAKALYERYKRWAESSGEFSMTQRAFGLAMSERGFERITSNGTWYVGIGINAGADV